MKMNNVSLITNYLDELFPNPCCELNYTKDYEFLIAVVLSAQTTDKKVNSVTNILFNKYPSLLALSKANLDDIIDIIRPIGTFNRKSVYIKEIASILYNKYNGIVPCDRASLESMPGVGRKVANVVLSELFHVPCIAVDTHVDRVSKRLDLANSRDSVKIVENNLCEMFPKDTWNKRHLQLVLFGRYYCKSINPKCSNCKLYSICNYNKKNKA